MKFRTACSRDCPDACGLEAEVVDGRLVALRGIKDDPVTKGFLCPRTTRFPERQHSPDRLAHPLLRRDGELQEISWDEALQLCVDKLSAAKRDFGAESIFHYKSGGNMGYLKSLIPIFFEQLGPVSVKRGDICSGAGEWAQSQDFGISDSSEAQDLLNAKLIVLWGKNVHTSSVHLVPTLIEAKKGGAKLVCIDPVPTKTSKLAHLSLCPKPGSDAQLALAIVTHLIESGAICPEASDYCDNLDEFLEMAQSVSFEERIAICGLELEEAREFAELYRALSPSSILIGWGAPRRANGADTVRCIDALAAVSGNLGVPGACASFYFQRKRSFRRAHLPEAREPARTFSETRLGEELKEASPSVRVAWITAGNPCAMLPDSATIAEELKKIDFVVVVDTHHTDTTECADLVLPTLSLVEDDDMLGAYGNHYIRVSQPAMKPHGESKHELWIFQQLAQRLGLGDFLEGSPRDWKERLLSPEVAREFLDGEPQRQPGAPKVVFKDRRFPTASGKVNLICTEPPRPEELDADYPLRLTALAHPDAQSSQWSIEPPNLPEARISTASNCPIEDGSQAMLETKKGRMKVLIRRLQDLHPEIVLLPKGGSRRFGGWCPNDLIEARETDHGGGACFYDEPARLLSL